MNIRSHKYIFNLCSILEVIYRCKEWNNCRFLKTKKALENLVVFVYFFRAIDCPVLFTYFAVSKIMTELPWILNLIKDGRYTSQTSKDEFYRSKDFAVDLNRWF